MKPNWKVFIYTDEKWYLIKECLAWITAFRLYQKIRRKGQVERISITPKNRDFLEWLDRRRR